MTSGPRLAGRAAIVSGGARGIGAAHVRALVGEGAHVVIGDVLDAEVQGFAAELSAERFRRTIDVNLTGHFLGIAAVTESMRRAGGGAIVNTSSMTSEIAVSTLAHYTASKHAIAGLTKAAALELAPFSIRVNSLHPGMIRSAMTEGAPEEAMAAKYPVRRFGAPEEVAATMLFIVCEATYASGDAFPVDGGILAGIMMGE
jgi:3alpha(or 20beta)-hydroxysteroid dehydrogenase